MHWFAAALSVAIIWGAVYAMTGRMLMSFSPFFLIVWSAVASLLLYLPLWIMTGVFNTDYRAFVSSQTNVKITFILIGIFSVIAHYLLYYAIQQKNATVASMVEITYPVFAILFLFVVYREIHLTSIGFLGVAVALAGLFLVLLGSR